MNNAGLNSRIIKEEAKKAGFDYCGISRAEFLEQEAPKLEKWLKDGMHGQMSYMEKYFDKRLNPTILVPGAKSVVSFLYNYYPSQQQEASAPKLSKYAFGNDYHEVIREKLRQLTRVLTEKIGSFAGRIFVDSAPVMDKAWAERSGLGWIGKNSNLISRNGSFFFIAELICDLELAYDGKMKDYCGTCTRCIDACPTEAIVEPYVVDGSKCISYFTIELKENIPDDFKDKMDGWVFGCDVCQDVCPWNSFSETHHEPLFNDDRGLLQFGNREWEDMTEEVFNSVFSKSAVKRTKYKGLKRNLGFIKRAS